MTLISQDDQLTAGAWAAAIWLAKTYNFAMTLILQDDQLTAGAWTACDLIS